MHVMRSIVMSVLVPVAATGLLVGCSSGNPNGSGDTADADGSAKALHSPSATATPTPSPTPTVDPVTYRRLLDAAVRPADAAFRTVSHASTDAAARRNLRAAAAKARAASAAVGRLHPPELESTAQQRLADALSAYADSLASASRASFTAKGCAGSAGLAGLADRVDPSELRGALESFDTGLAPHLTPVSFPKPRDRQLANGHFLRSGYRNGSGTLQISNGSESDAIVALAVGRRTSFSVYIRRSRSYTVKGIRHGTYTAYFATGRDYDARSRGFTRDCAFKRFDKSVGFPSGYITSQYMTLYGVIGGNASTTEIGRSQFPH